MKIQFIGHSYHKSTGSSGFFVSILERLGDIDFAWDEEWINPARKLSLDNLDDYDLTVIWQLPHVAAKVPENLKKKVVYVPMYDAVARIGARFWRQLRGMRIICFSYTNYIECINNKTQAFYIQYFPEAHERAIKFDTLKLFFWQRQSAPNWRTIGDHVPVAQFDAIHLHTAIDPGNGPLVTPLDCEIKKFNITLTDWFEKKSDFFETLESCNTYIAPRYEEGIGMSFLEAMQRGLVTIGNNAPTMNEYIVHGMNGYLTPPPDGKPIVVKDAEAISQRTLETVKAGHARYKIQIGDLLDFLNSEAKPKFRKVISPALEKINHKKALVNFDLKSLPVLPISQAGKRKPKVTVVTVVRNDAEGLLKTIRSVAEQTFNDFNYLIMDGLSTDKTKAILRDIPSHFAQVVSESDRGPYDAMNKAVARADGEYVIFMNAGDTFFSSRALEFAMIGAPTDADIIYGHHAYIPEKKSCRIHKTEWLPGTFEALREGKLSYAWLHGIPCHQATMIKTEMLRKRPFNTPKYKIAADHDLLFDLLSKGARSYHANTIIANYYGGGMSAQNVKRCVSEWRDIATNYSVRPELAAKFYDTGHF